MSARTAKSDEIESLKAITIDTPRDDISLLSKRANFRILILRYSLAFIICALAAGLGAGSLHILRDREQQQLLSQLESASIQTTRSLTRILQRLNVAATLIDDIYKTEMSIQNGELPNYTLPGFEKIVGSINALSNIRAAFFSPLVNTTNRSSWEAYAANNVGLLNGPASLTTRTGNSWIVADGIYTTSATIPGGLISAPKKSTSVKYPNLFFPVWNIAPLAAYAFGVMYDPHFRSGTRQEAIDRMLSTGAGTASDVIQVVADRGTYRPSTSLFFPVTKTSGAIVGLMALAFTWDQLFVNMLPSYLSRIDCVISSATTSFTLSLDSGKVTLLGPGDLHDNTFNAYMSVIAPTDPNNLLTGYSIKYYPSNAFYSTYVTSYPQSVCIGAVFVVVFTAIIITLYVHLVNTRQAKLEEAITSALIRDSSRDAVLQSKKTYVRYISHEMRTPLNVAFIGLKLLNKDLTRDPVLSDLLETVDDISKACHMALGILNDLLKYDKLEDGTLLMEPQRMDALPFIMEITDVLNFQAKEKGLIILFDVYDESTLNNLNNSVLKAGKHHKEITDEHWTLDPPGGISSYLSPTDQISVDPNKMNQVIGNLISNAIKFTPVGQSVTIRARKVLPDLKYLQFIDSDERDMGRTTSKHASYHSRLRRAVNYFNVFKYRSKKPIAEYDLELGGTEKTHKNTHNNTHKNTHNNTHTNTRINTHINGRSNSSHNNDRISHNNSYTSSQINSHNNSATNIHNNYKKDEKLFPLNMGSAGYLMIEVSDSGVGMAPEDSKRLFKEIVQFNPSKLQAGGGSGLGMMITKGIVDLHGGEISVYSAGEGFGSTFTLKIPLLATPAISRDYSLEDERLERLAVVGCGDDRVTLHPTHPTHPTQP